MPMPSPAFRRWTTFPAIAALAGAAPVVFAHTGADAGHVHGLVQSLGQGLAHPFTGPDHLAAMLALGAWSALTMRRKWLAPMAFAAALLVGAVMAMAGLRLPAIEPMIAASLLVLGLLMVTGTRLPLSAGMALAAAFALFHGSAHGQELNGSDGAWALAGMVAATMMLHASGIGMGLLVQRRATWMPRVAGAAVAAFGAVLLLPMLATRLI